MVHYPLEGVDHVYLSIILVVTHSLVPSWSRVKPVTFHTPVGMCMSSHPVLCGKLRTQQNTGPLVDNNS